MVVDQGHRVIAYGWCVVDACNSPFVVGLCADLLIEVVSKGKYIWGLEQRVPEVRIYGVELAVG